MTLDYIFISVTKCLSLLLAPLVGLLADVKFGRYEIIKTGSLVAFFASLFHYFALLLGEDVSLLRTLLFCAMWGNFLYAIVGGAIGGIQ